MAEYIHINGTVEKIIYQSPESWYSVCDICTDGGEAITIVGIMPYISVGEGIEADGTWVSSKEHGKQFKVEDYKKVLPKQKNSILRYLSSGAIKGIGPKIAKKIVEQYGEDSFDVIANHPDWLAQINGISRKKAYDMSFDFKEKADIRELMALSNGVLSTDSAVKIHKKWGRNALGIVRENPYVLCTGDFGVGFKRADEIALSFGISRENINRIEAGIRYVLSIYASRDGHTYVKEEILKDSVSKLLEIEIGKVNELFKNGCSVAGVCSLNIENSACVALEELYFAEINIAKRLRYLDKHASHLNDSNIDYVVADIEKADGIKYAHLQKKAIFESLSNGVFVLTGGPGTGKTTVIKALLKIYEKLGMKCALCAPTGRASKRMSESTQHEAKTIHRLLDVAPMGEIQEKNRFNFNKDNPLLEDVIIVDETSMVDVGLMNSLLMALKTGARLVLIGDTNQLPSVGEGNVLNDIIKSEVFSTVCLNEIFRQSQDSGIVVNAHKINNGVYPDLKEKFDDFFFIQKSDDEIPPFIAQLCKERLPKKYNETVKEGIQVITPTKKGLNGTVNLNYILQEVLNPQKATENEIKHGQNKIFRLGDKVMQTKNNYEIEWIDQRDGFDISGQGIFNGDIGIINEIDDKIVKTDFSGRLVEYMHSDLDEVELSYAITVHKSQGSEYPIVIIPISRACPPILQTRNLIYTAITRAEKVAILIGDKETFFNMIENNTQICRNTNLARLLVKEK